MATKRSFEATADQFQHESEGAARKMRTYDTSVRDFVVVNEKTLAPIPDITQLLDDPTSRISKLPRDIVLYYLHFRYLDPIGVRDPAFESRIKTRPLHNYSAELNLALAAPGRYEPGQDIRYCSVPPNRGRLRELGFFGRAIRRHGMVAMLIAASDGQLLAEFGGDSPSDHSDDHLPDRYQQFLGIVVDPETSEYCAVFLGIDDAGERALHFCSQTTGNNKTVSLDTSSEWMNGSFELSTTGVIISLDPPYTDTESQWFISRPMDRFQPINRPRTLESTANRSNSFSITQDMLDKSGISVISRAHQSARYLIGVKIGSGSNIHLQVYFRDSQKTIDIKHPLSSRDSSILFTTDTGFVIKQSSNRGVIEFYSVEFNRQHIRAQ